MSKIYFFRHAQASIGAANYDVLSPKGELQAVELGQYLANKQFQFDTIYVGPLRRQQHTYEIVKSVFDKQNLPLPEPTTLDGLKEHEATTAMKLAMPDLIQNDPFIRKVWEESEANPKLKKSAMMKCFQYFIGEWANGRYNVDGILPWAEFRKDVKEGLQTILKNTDSGQNIAAFTSGGTISSITAEALQIENQERITALNYSIRNTSFTSFFYSKGQFNLLGFNELPHLSEEMITFV